MMPFHRAAVFLFVPALVSAAESKLPPGPGAPTLRLEASGPTSMVTALAFSPDGETLYAAGYDKIVRTWQYDDATKRFVRKPELTFRVPLGPGLAGSLNALAVSPDGKWLAVGGFGLQRGLPGYREPGVVLSRISLVDDAMRHDRGLVFLFERDNPRAVRLLRKHRGPVIALAFVPGKPAVLASLAQEWDGKKDAGVLRLWDVEKADELAQSPPLPDPKGQWPSLAAWRGGRDGEDLRVAVAFQEKPLFLWDATSKELHEAKRSGIQNDTLALLPHPTDEAKHVLLTGSYQAGARGGGQLQAWQVRPGQAPVEDAERGRILAPACAPNALALLASGTDGLDHAAVALWFPPAKVDQPHRYELRLVALGAGEDRFGEVKRRLSLWEGLPGKPVLATAPRGRFLAVTGYPDHSIRLFSIKDLLAGRDASLQPPLQSEGLPRHTVAFVKKAGQLGLAVNGSEGGAPSPGTGPRAPRDGDLIVDFNGNRVLKQTEGWELDRPDEAGWAVEYTPATPKAPAQFDISRAGRAVQRIVLKRGQVVTQYALLPPRLLEVPLLAVAVVDGGETDLVLLDAENGAKLRRLTGHVNPVRALSFSSDGKWLASAADDQTVCVWRLTDLGRLLSAQGMLRGLVVNDTADGLAVAEINRDDLNASNRRALADVRPGDAVQGMILEGRRRPLRSADAFYRSVWQLKPGPKNPVKFRIGDNDIELVVDQGIDDRKPLLSLFLTRQSEWVAWSPQGPYDFSAATAENLIGWHKNTGRVDGPVEFQKADVYRKEFHTPGLLGQLLGQGSARRPEGKPVLTVWIDELGLRPALVDDRGRPILRRPPVTLAASVDNVDPERISFLRWQIGRDDWQEFTDDLGSTRKVDLSNRVRWTRGEHRIRVSLLPFEVNAREQIEEHRLLFLPPAPEVVFSKEWLGRVEPGKALREPDFVFEALVRPASGQQVEVTVELNGRKVFSRVIDEPVKGDDHNVRASLRLAERPGKDGKTPNEIVFVARNRGVLPGYESYEEVRRVFTVPHIPTAVPEVAVQAVVPSAPREAPREGGVVVVTEKEVRIRGTIRAEENLTLAELDGKSLFDPKKKPGKVFDFDVPYTSKGPGRKTVEITARAVGSGLRTYKFDIDYQPPLPRFRLLAPSDLLRVPSAKREIRLRGEFTPSASKDYTIEVRHNRRVVTHELNGGGRFVEVPLSLDPGGNDLDVIARLDGRKESARLRAYVLQPPKVRPVEHPATSKTSVISLEAEVETPADLPLVGARLTNDQYPRTSIDLRRDLKEKGTEKGRRIWVVALKNVPLKENIANALRLSVLNGDGESSIEFTIKGPPPVVQRPVVTILSPLDDVSLDTPTHRIHFKIASENPLRRIAILREGQPPQEVPVASEEYQPTLALRPGRNPFRVEAVNDGGRSESVERVITYVPDTVFIQLGTLTPTGGGQPLLAHRAKDGWSFARVGSGSLRLRGSVEWPVRRDDLRRPVRVRLWVNGFEQFPGGLESAGGGLRRTFELPLRLNQEKDNRIELEFEGLKIDPTTPPRFTVARCDEPVRDQRLHLLVIGVGVKDTSALARKVLGAFKAKNVRDVPTMGLPRKEFETGAFNKGGRLYGPLPPDADIDDIYRALRNISEGLRGERSPYNDVVVVYFQGEARTQGGRHYLLTQESKGLENYSRAALTLTGLRQKLADAPGAQLLLLDLEHKGEGSEGFARSLMFPRVGVFYYAWVRPGPPPENARLLDALEQSLPRSANLQDVWQRLSALARQTGMTNDGLLYGLDPPKEMAGLRIGDPGEK